jgi:hypothetical protein
MSGRPEIRPDPLVHLLREIKSIPSTRMALYNAIRSNLQNKIAFYSKSVAKEYRKVIREQQKAFSNMCAYGIQPKTIILELQQRSSGKPVFVNVDLEHGPTTLLPSPQYYKFQAYPFIEEIKKFQRIDSKLQDNKFQISLGLIASESTRGDRAAPYPTPGLFQLITQNPYATTDDGQYEIQPFPEKIGFITNDRTFVPCASWNLARTKVLEGSNDSEALKEARREYEAALQVANAQWTMCVQATDRLKLFPDPPSDVQLNTALQDFESAVVEFINSIKGQARIGIKQEVCDFIMNYLRSPTYYSDKYLNFALLGGAGTGKTTLAIILGKLLSSLGILVTPNSTVHSRSTLVGSYIGQTAEKTRAQLVDNLEGVMFVDEAYALTQSSAGGGDDGDPQFDPFGIESLNEFINFMDKTKGRISIIVAGYEHEMNTYWFGPNEGMVRRMPIVWRLENYSAQDLFDISTYFYRIEFDRSPLILPNISFEGKLLTESLCDLVEDADHLLTMFNRCCDTVRDVKGNSFARLRNQAGDVENVVRELTSMFIKSLRDIRVAVGGAGGGAGGGEMEGALLSRREVEAAFDRRFILKLDNETVTSKKYIADVQTRDTSHIEPPNTAGIERKVNQLVEEAEHATPHSRRVTRLVRRSQRVEQMVNPEAPFPRQGSLMQPYTPPHASLASRQAAREEEPSTLAERFERAQQESPTHPENALILEPTLEAHQLVQGGVQGGYEEDDATVDEAVATGGAGAGGAGAAITSESKRGHPRRSTVQSTMHRIDPVNVFKRLVMARANKSFLDNSNTNMNGFFSNALISSSLYDFGIRSQEVTTTESMFAYMDDTGQLKPYNYLQVLLGTVKRTGTAPPGGLAMLDYDTALSEDEDDGITKKRTKPYVSFDDFKALFDNPFLSHPKYRSICARMFVQFFYVFYRNWKDLPKLRRRDGLVLFIEILSVLERGGGRLPEGTLPVTRAFYEVKKKLTTPINHDVTNLLRLLVTFQHHALEVVEVLENPDHAAFFRQAVEGYLVPLGVNPDEFVAFVLDFSRDNSLVAVGSRFGGRIRHQIMKSNIRREINRLKQNPSPHQRMKVIEMIHHQSHFNKNGLTISM